MVQEQGLGIEPMIPKNPTYWLISCGKGTRRRKRRALGTDAGATATELRVNLARRVAPYRSKGHGVHADKFSIDVWIDECASNDL